MSQIDDLRVDREIFHDLRLNGKRVLLHVPSSGVFVLDEVTSELLDYLGERSSVTPGAVADRLGSHAPETVREAIADFRVLGILRAAGAAQDSAPTVEVREFPLSTIVLNVNTGCNLSCTYCYKEDLASPAAGKRLSFETAKRGIDLLLREGSARERLNVVFFGGEPLSNVNLIRAVTEYAEQRCAEAGKEVEFSLTTNATLLTEELADYFDAHRFGLSVSIDGPQAVHDRRRVSVGGAGTYAVVARKARMLLARCRAKPVGARVTVTSGYTDVVAIHRHLKGEIGFAEVGFAPVTSSPVAAFNLDAGELRAFFEAMKELGRDYVAAALRGESNGFSNMHQLMSDLYKGRKKSLPCGAGVGLLAVDHKGDLNLCHRFTGSALRTFGNVEAGIDKVGLGGFIERAIDRSGRGCEACRIRNLCSGGCYHESYVQFNDPHAPVHHYCGLLRQWVDFGIECYLEILERNPGFLHQQLSHRRAEL